MCSGEQVVIDKGGIKTLCNEGTLLGEGYDDVRTGLSLLPGGYLKGVAVEVTLGSHEPKSYAAAWFDLYTCEDDGNTWSSLGVSVWREEGDENTTVIGIWD